MSRKASLCSDAQVFSGDIDPRGSQEWASEFSHSSCRVLSKRTQTIWKSERNFPKEKTSEQNAWPNAFPFRPQNVCVHLIQTPSKRQGGVNWGVWQLSTTTFSKTKRRPEIHNSLSKKCSPLAARVLFCLGSYWRLSVEYCGCSTQAAQLRQLLVERECSIALDKLQTCGTMAHAFGMMPSGGPKITHFSRRALLKFIWESESCSSKLEAQKALPTGRSLSRSAVTFDAP